LKRKTKAKPKIKSGLRRKLAVSKVARQAYARDFAGDCCGDLGRKPDWLEPVEQTGGAVWRLL